MPVYSLGHLVHNSYVVNQFKDAGVHIVGDVESILTPGYLIISAHGVAQAIIDRACEKGLMVVDTTCGQVKRVQEIVGKLKEQHYTIIIIGDKEHPEVKGLKERAGNASFVVSDVLELENAILPPKVGIVAQTTQSRANVTAVIDYLRSQKSIIELQVYDTICGATTSRQNAVMELARDVDVMLVIGDTKSANTRRLTELSRQFLADTYQIQDVHELQSSWLNHKKRIGITAGASTPDFIIEEVVTYVTRYQS